VIISTDNAPGPAPTTLGAGIRPDPCPGGVDRLRVPAEELLRCSATSRRALADDRRDAAIIETGSRMDEVIFEEFKVANATWNSVPNRRDCRGAESTRRSTSKCVEHRGTEELLFDRNSSLQVWSCAGAGRPRGRQGPRSCSSTRSARPMSNERVPRRDRQGHPRPVRNGNRPDVTPRRPIRHAWA